MVASDRRAVTVQIGAVLLLGILVLMLTTYQAAIVPDANKATEFDHSQTVLDEMQSLQAEYHNAMSTGDDVESTVKLGTDYQSRLAAINPPPASGQFTTTSPEEISSDEIDIEDIGEHDGETRTIQYEPNYHEYQNPPTITFESSVLYSDFGDEYVVESEQSIISGDRITLTPLEGEISKTGTGRTSVRFQPGPRETAEETVGSEFRLTIPTAIPADQWENDSMLLAEELTEEGGNVDRVENNASADGVDIILESGTYDIQYRASGLTDAPSTGSAEDASEDGGSEESPVGQSGTSEFTEGDTETISASGGLWSGVSDVNSLRLTDPRFAPTAADDGKVDEDNRYFRFGITIANDTTEYAFLVGDDPEGLDYEQEPTDRDWKDQDVSLYEYEEGSDPDDVFKGRDLTVSALDNWLDGGELELLDELSYEKPSKVDSGLKDVRTFLNNSDDSEIYITSMHGRTEVTLDQLVDDSEAYFLSIDDGSEEMEPHAVEPPDSDEYNALQFALVNGLTEDTVEITSVSLNITDGPTAEEIQNDHDGDGDDYGLEFYFEGDDTDGEIDGSFETGSMEALDPNGDIGDDDDTVVYVNGFKDADGDPVELEEGDEIETSYEYIVDGETYDQTLTFEIKDRKDGS